MSTTAIQKLRFHEPSRNLPDHPGDRSEENLMTCRFAQAYRSQFSSVHPNSFKLSSAAAREIPANGYGIADLVSVNWDTDRTSPAQRPLNAEMFIEWARPVIRAFEMKIADWRRALMQANRYRFFAHVGIVVLPQERCGVALRYLETFQKVGVGLWSFNRETDRIVTHFTPRPSTPLDIRQELRVLRLIARVSRVLPIV